jgi:hypothetical protein
MEKDTDLYLIGKVTAQDDYEVTKLFILPLDKRTLKSLRLARFLAWLIRLLMSIEDIGDVLWPKKQKPPCPPPFSFESIQFSFWGHWITGENLPEDDSDDEAVEALLDGNDFAIFTRADIEARYPGLLSSEETPGIRGTSASVAPNGHVYIKAFHKYDGSEVFASAHISDILARKATASPPSDSHSHRYNPDYCAKCGGDCLYDDQGNLAQPLASDELRCLDCGAAWSPKNWTSPACPDCGSQNYEG